MEERYFEEEEETISLAEFSMPVDDECDRVLGKLKDLKEDVQKYIDIESNKLKGKETVNYFSTSASSSSSSSSASASASASSFSCLSFLGGVLPFVGDNRKRQPIVFGLEDLKENAQKNKDASISGIGINLSSPATSSARRTTNVTIDELLESFPEDLLTYLDDDINPVFITLDRVKERIQRCDDIIAGLPSKSQAHQC